MDHQTKGRGEKKSIRNGRGDLTPGEKKGRKGRSPPSSSLSTTTKKIDYLLEKGISTAAAPS